MGSTKNKREELRDILLEICENVYYSPPSGHKLKYPCIIYERRYSKAEYADNKPYTTDTSYTLTVIDKSQIVRLFQNSKDWKSVDMTDIS